MELGTKLLFCGNGKRRGGHCGDESMNEDQRAALLRQKIEIDDRLNRLKIKQLRARTDARTRRIYMDRDEYAKLAVRILNLKTESQLLQVQIGNLAKPTTVESRFVELARQLLPTQQFEEIFNKAKEHG